VSTKDAIIPFVFDDLPVRGALVQLDSSWQRMQEGHSYARPAADILGHAAAATALIAQSLKFDGTVTLQISSEGPLGVLVMQSTDRLDLRGMATARDIDEHARYADIVSGARCAVTVDAGHMERPYQGIVEISPDSLAASLETYFARSVQIPSHLKLVSTPDFCGGILLQQMPGEAFALEDDWRRLGFLAETLRPEDLGEGVSKNLLHKIFAEDDVRAYEFRFVRFSCRCTQERVEDVLRLLGEAETRKALVDIGSVDVTCEYCGRVRSFDAVDVSRVFAGPTVAGTTSVH